MNSTSNMDNIHPGKSAVLSALHRAAQAARQLAIDTNTDLIVAQNGKLVHIPPQELRRQQKSEEMNNFPR